MDGLEDLFIKCGFAKSSEIDYDFSQLEDFLGFELPSDYKYYLNNFETFDGDIGKQYVVLYEASELLDTNKDFNIKAHIADTIAIGSNGASETIGLRRVAKNTFIAVAAQYISDVDDHIKIGESFTDMIQRLHRGREWFT